MTAVMSAANVYECLQFQSALRLLLVHSLIHSAFENIRSIIVT